MDDKTIDLFHGFRDNLYDTKLNLTYTADLIIRILKTGYLHPSVDNFMLKNPFYLFSKILMYQYAKNNGVISDDMDCKAVLSRGFFNNSYFKELLISNLEKNKVPYEKDKLENIIRGSHEFNNRYYINWFFNDKQAIEHSIFGDCYLEFKVPEKFIAETNDCGHVQVHTPLHISRLKTITFNNKDYKHCEKKYGPSYVKSCILDQLQENLDSIGIKHEMIFNEKNIQIKLDMPKEESPRYEILL